MTHSQMQARPKRREARFTALTARILLRRPVTVEQVQEIGDLALDLAIIKRPQPARSRLISFPPRPPSAEKQGAAGSSESSADPTKSA